MSDSADAVVSVNLQGKEYSEPAVLHLMPCEVNASGVSKAKVDCYFTSTMKEDGPNSEMFRASFRGRPLHGAHVTIPDDYTGVVLDKSEGRGEVSYSKTSSFSSFYYWNLDKKVTQDDHIQQCMQWTRISNAIHQKV